MQDIKPIKNSKLKIQNKNSAKAHSQGLAQKKNDTVLAKEYKKPLSAGSTLQKLKNFVISGWPMMLILAVAAFLRFYKLDSLPQGLHPDEAANGLDIISMFDAHKFAAVYDTNGPREALFFYLQAIPVWIGHVTGWAAMNFTPLSLRVAPAIIGILTVWGIYLLGKELFNKNVGIFAAAALAVSAWHVQFSRNGFRAIMAPLALIFLFYFFIRFYRNNNTKDYIGAGLSLALGFYTYLSFRVTPLVLIALLAYILLTDRNFILRNMRKIGYFVAATLVVMIPLLVHFAYVPADLIARSSASIFNPQTNGGSAIKALFLNIIKTAGMFNFSGDQNFRQNVAGEPMLDIFVGILMWAGIVISLIKFKKIEYFLLVVWFVALSIPELLTSDGIPHALRMVGVIPVVFLWAALGLEWALAKIKVKQMVYVGMASILIISGAAGFYKYFVQFPSYAQARDAYAEDMTQMAYDINAQPKGEKIILIAGEYGSKTVQFITHSTKPDIERLEIRDIKGLKLPESNYKIYIERDWEADALKELRKIGFKRALTSVPSPADQRIIYYEYSR